MRELVVPRAEWNANGVSALVRLGDQVERVSFVTSEDAGREVDFLLPLTLLPAMRRGSRLQLPGMVSPRLFSSAPRIQDVFHLWGPQFFQRVPLDVEMHTGHAERASGIATFFSGGVDSFYTLLKHRDEISHLIFVHGFYGVSLKNRSLREQASQAAREVARELGKTLIEVETNICHFSFRTRVGWMLYHGAAQASVALLFQSLFRKVIIPSAQSYADLVPWGTHPLLDPLWSTELTDVEHDGCEATRFEKVARISSHELAMKWLRVCNEGLKGVYNCGRCGKCLRTMIALRATGALERCETLPNDLDLEAVANMNVNPEYGAASARGLLDALVRLGTEPILAQALEEAIGKGVRRSEAKTEHGGQEQLQVQLPQPYAQPDIELVQTRAELVAARLEADELRTKCRKLGKRNSQLIARYSSRRYKLADTLTKSALRIPGIGRLLQRKSNDSSIE